ncbi:acyltransferase [Paenibacillus sp. FSL L8-0323]|uniref:acyltransferase family protein n=1 Tax=Paenibacillus sp. FSL L8-0323 TaxID=2975330 RepID=UPI0030F5A3CC
MPKLKYVDGFRGLAAVVVVLNHFFLAFYPALINGDKNQVHTINSLELIIAKSPLNLLYNGDFAICVFFILSGYVLSYKYSVTGNIKVLTESAVKRYIRLLVPVFASVIFSYIFIRYSLYFNQEAGNLSLSTWWLATFWNFDVSFFDVVKNAFFGVFFKSDSKYNPALWTMTYELYGSFLVFGFAALFGKLKKRYLLYIIAVVLLYKTYYLGFILGLILSDLNVSGYINNYFIRKSLFKVSFLVVGLYFASYPSAATVENSMYIYIESSDPFTIMTYHTFGAFLIMLVLLNSVKLQKMLSLKPFEFIGRISFSMYLLHLILIGSLSSYIFILLIDHVSYSVAVMISFVSTVPILLILSHFMYKYVDKQGIKLANSIYNRFFKDSTR